MVKQPWRTRDTDQLNDATYIQNDHKLKYFTLRIKIHILIGKAGYKRNSLFLYNKQLKSICVVFYT